MLSKYLEDRIHIVDEISDWKEAIKVGAKSLLDKGYITPQYVEAMIENVIENGTYIIILPQIAIPHARPERGAMQTSMALLKLNTPVLFPEKTEVSLLMVLAANDNDSHLELISMLSEVLENSHTIETILQASTTEAIEEALRQVVV